MNRLKSQLNFTHVLIKVKHYARRALLASAKDYLMKATGKCAINTLIGNHKLNRNEKNELIKKGSFIALVNPKIGFESKYKLSNRQVYSSTAHNILPVLLE